MHTVQCTGLTCSAPIKHDAILIWSRFTHVSIPPLSAIPPGHGQAGRRHSSADFCSLFLKEGNTAESVLFVKDEKNFYKEHLLLHGKDDLGEPQRAPQLRVDLDFCLFVCFIEFKGFPRQDLRSQTIRKTVTLEQLINAISFILSRKFSLSPPYF